MPRRRVLLLLALGAIAIAIVVGGLLRWIGDDQSPNDPVAHVRTTAITRGQLDETVAHFRQEADKEGKPFPDEGSDGYHTVERQLVALLVYHTELEQTAARLGVAVTDGQVQARVATATNETEDAAERRFAEAAVRAQLAYEHIYRKVTRGLPAERRGQAASDYIAKMKRDYADDVTYEDGYAPAA